MSFSFGRPSCELVLCCVWAPNLRTCLALRWGIQLADVRTCLAFALRTCLALRWGAQLADMSSISSFSLVLPCVDVFVVDVFFVWATILQTCVGAPNLRTCLVLRWGAQLADVPCVAFERPSCERALNCVGVPNLGEVVLKSLPPCQNLFLSILQLIF
jgi:hypothetical protein